MSSCTPADFAAAMIAFGVGLSLEPADILGDGAVEQLDVLRQIADMPAERLRRPLVERRAVQPHLAADGCHTPTISRASEDLARGTRTDDAEAIAALEREGDVLHDDASVAGRVALTTRPKETSLGLAAAKAACAPARRRAARKGVDALAAPRQILSNWRWPARPAQAHAT